MFADVETIKKYIITKKHVTKKVIVTHSMQKFKHTHRCTQIFGRLTPLKYGDFSKSSGI